MQDITKTRKVIALWMLICLFMCAVMPVAAARAESASGNTAGRTVRVGWHEPPYCIIDESGRRSGFTYDYQQKVAAYTGWNYEYVEGSWSELLEMLKRGDIDLMGDVSYMDERAEDMLYASLPMGTEAYYLFIAPDNKEIKAEDYASLNGKKVGVSKGTIQSEMFREWTDTHGVEVDLVELDSQATESMQLLGTELDAFVTMDVYADNELAIPVWKIGSSDFFFAVSKKSPELLNDLNFAMNRIQDENKFFGQQLYDKYLRSSETELYLSDREKEWLNSHGPIRVGYQDNYLAFCSSDPDTGELTGALKDYLDYASTALENTRLEFETVAYPTAADAIEALKAGEVDCVFPANLTYYDSETLGIVMTPALMSTEMDAVVRVADQKEFVHKEDVTVAVNEGNTNYVLFLQEHFPDWQIKYYQDTPTGLNAVAAGEADCVIISNYRFGNISKQCDKLNLTTVYTGVNMDYYFAVCKGETDLYSILSRVNAAVPASTVHTALTYYSTEDVKMTFVDYIRRYLGIIMTVVAVILAIIVFLLLRSFRAEKKAREEERMINALNRKVYVDALTSVRNKGAFAACIKELQEKTDQEGTAEFAIGVFDCDDLKLVNDRHGHEKGDEYLKTASCFICRIFQHSPVFRIGGDEFAVILQNDDFYNRDELISRFKKEEREISDATDNMWDQVSVSMGIAVYDPMIDSSVNDTVQRADKLMYENKRIGKNGR